MATSYGPDPIITDGLTFYVDPGNQRCWSPTTSTSGSCDSLITQLPATGSLWNDVSGSLGGDGSWVFDGTDDRIDFPPMESTLTSVSQFSVSFWFKQDQVEENRWCGKRNAGEWISCQNNAGSLILFVIMDGGTSYGGFDPSGIVGLNTWYQYVGVFNGTLSGNINRCKIYINGEDQVLTYTGTIPATTSDFSGIEPPFTVGTDGYAYMDGNISLVMLYNRAITPTEITQNYNSQKARFGL